MVLESLINVKKAEREPWEMFFLGFVYASIGVFLGMWIFREEASLVMVFLTVLACIPLIYQTLINEEEKDLKYKEKRLLSEHWKVLSYFMYLFFGFTVGFAIWYVILPADVIKGVFATQLQTIDMINAQISGVSSININMNIITGGATGLRLFLLIFENNIKVLLFSIFFSFFYGAGMIFILAWNASVISAAIGTFVRDNLTSALGISYFSLFTIGILRYMTHGFFEILAYFVGGLAGGIISVAVIKHDVQTKRFMRVLSDSFYLIAIAFGLLVVSAFIEVYVTPVLF